MPSPWDETRVGMFETIRVSKGRPVAWAAHWARLRESQQTVGRPRPSAGLQRQLLRAIRRAARGTTGVRLDVSTTSGDPAIAAQVLPRRRARSASPWRRGIEVVTAVGRQGSPAALPAQVKSRERLAGVMAWGEAAHPPVREVLWRNAQGLMTEGTVSNLFMVRHGQLVTPPTWSGVLPGIMRAAILQAARRLKLSVVEQPFTRHELFTASEAFVSNSLIGIVPIRTVDGRRIGSRCPGIITQRLRRAAAARVGKG